MHINLAEEDHKIIAAGCRAHSEQLADLNNQLVKVEHRLEAVLKDLIRTIGRDQELADRLEDTVIGLETVQTLLDRLTVPEFDDLEINILESSHLRVREAANYSPTQAELEAFLSEKLARGESINQHLVSGSFSVRRAAKHVLKQDRNRE